MLGYGRGLMHGHTGGVIAAVVGAVGALVFGFLFGAAIVENRVQATSCEVNEIAR